MRQSVLSDQGLADVHDIASRAPFVGRSGSEPSVGCSLDLRPLALWDSLILLV